MMKKLIAVLCVLVTLLTMVPAMAEDSHEIALTVSVDAEGCVLQQADAKGKATGASTAHMDVTSGDNEFVVTATIPKGKKLDHWVINGVRYDFNKVPKSIRIKNLGWDCTIEAVLKKAPAQTTHTVEQIQDSRTGEQLLLKTINADFYFYKKAKTLGKTAMREFNFTQDYTNTASGKKELGGRITARVKAKIPGSKKVDYWLFNDAQFHFSTAVTAFTVTDLDASMTYEPVLAKTAQYYTVKCTNCTFSGGGYTNATSGKVKYGTKITVTSNFLAVSKWTRNGAVWQKQYYDEEVGYYNFPVQQKSFTWTVKSNCTFSCTQQIN